MPAPPSASQKRTETTNAIALQLAKKVHLINTERNGHLREVEESGSCTLLIFVFMQPYLTALTGSLSFENLPF